MIRSKDGALTAPGSRRSMSSPTSSMVFRSAVYRQPPPFCHHCLCVLAIIVPSAQQLCDLLPSNRSYSHGHVWSDLMLVLPKQRIPRSHYQVCVQFVGLSGISLGGVADLPSNGRNVKAFRSRNLRLLSRARQLGTSCASLRRDI